MLKEKYFTQQNQEEKVTSWKNHLRQIKKHQPFRFSKENGALLVLDMQNVFLNDNSHAFVPSAPEIIPNIQKLINYFEKHQRPIIFTQHSNPPDSRGINLMNLWWKNPIMPNSFNFELFSALKLPISSIIIQKQYYSAFYQTPLTSILNEKKVDMLVITGVMTHLCCESTARDAFMRGFKSFVVIDGTASYNEQVHLGSLSSLAHGFSLYGSFNDILGI